MNPSDITVGLDVTRERSHPDAVLVEAFYDWCAEAAKQRLPFQGTSVASGDRLADGRFLVGWCEMEGGPYALMFDPAKFSVTAQENRATPSERVGGRVSEND